MTRQKRTISHHMLRRRARARVAQLHAAQRATTDNDARELLARYGVNQADMLRVEPAKRGPWRWYVTAV